ncbi:MAG: DPP IV N-terminal domain-containing protein [Pirellulaceae bacterium]
MRTLLLLAMLCFALSTARSAEPPAWKPESADLLFMSGRDGNGEIYLLTGGEREWKNLTNHKSSDNWPGWSPDGKQIVFQSNRSGNLDIWTMNADGSNQVQLTKDSQPDYLPDWSPDGKSILFTSWRTEKEDEKRAPHIYLMNADGSGQRRLIAESLNTSAGATWSPDGKRIVFSRQTGKEGADLFVAGSDGKDEQRLTSDEAKDLYNGSPTFSPDGKSIAFYSASKTASALEVMNADGTDRRTILAEGQNWYPRWSPDGGWLVYTAEAGDKKNIDVFAIALTAGSTPVLLAGGEKREQEASWRPK